MKQSHKQWVGGCVLMVKSILFLSACSVGCWYADMLNTGDIEI